MSSKHELERARLQVLLVKLQDDKSLAGDAIDTLISVLRHRIKFLSSSKSNKYRKQIDSVARCAAYRSCIFWLSRIRESMLTDLSVICSEAVDPPVRDTDDADTDLSKLICIPPGWKPPSTK